MNHDEAPIANLFCKMAERNPSPPRLSQEERELIESDNIGDTVFSKKWVLKTLMKLVEKVNTESEESGGENDGESSVNEASVVEEERTDNQNLDEEFDTELCELWDMSMNQVNVGKYVYCCKRVICGKI